MHLMLQKLTIESNSNVHLCKTNLIGPHFFPKIELQSTSNLKLKHDHPLTRAWKTNEYPKINFHIYSTQEAKEPSFIVLLLKWLTNAFTWIVRNFDTAMSLPTTIFIEHRCMRTHFFLIRGLEPLEHSTKILNPNDITSFLSTLSWQVEQRGECESKCLTWGAGGGVEKSLHAMVLGKPPTLKDSNNSTNYETNAKKLSLNSNSLARTTKSQGPYGNIP